MPLLHRPGCFRKTTPLGFSFAFASEGALQSKSGIVPFGQEACALFPAQLEGLKPMKEERESMLSVCAWTEPSQLAWLHRMHCRSSLHCSMLSMGTWIQSDGGRKEQRIEPNLGPNEKAGTPGTS